MGEAPVQRYFLSERVAWTARRSSKPPSIRFLSGFGEQRILRLEGAALPSEEQLASASQQQLEDWLARSQREPRS